MAEWIAYTDLCQKTEESQAAVNDSAMAMSILQAALDSTNATNKRCHKPNLPPFDRDNIDIWIKCFEAAYVRAEFMEPKDKF